MASGDFGGLIMVDGGRGETLERPVSAVDQFNRMAIDSPVYGHNVVLDRMSKFDNSAKFSFDEEPELDEFVQTLFLDPLGDHGYDVDGDPYGEFKKMQGGLTGEPAEVDTTQSIDSALAFMNSFGKVFEKK